MAMEVDKSIKKLRKHTLSITMVAAGLLLLSGLLFNRYNTSDFQTESAFARGLTSRFIRVEPKSNGLAKVTVNDHKNKPAGSSLNGGRAQAGAATHMLFTLQSGAGGESRTPVTSLEN